jgi:RNA polymerase sigma-70 factor (ECF subfamily)
MDEQEVRRVVKTYADMIKRISYNYLQNTYDSEDICQSVFLKYMTAESSFISKEHEKAWMIRTTINACHDLKKSSFFRKTVELTEAADKEMPEANNYGIMEEIKRLPVNYRTAIYLYYFEGYNTEEIADIMGKRKGAVSKYLSRGRKILKDTLSDEYASMYKVGEQYDQ